MTLTEVEEPVALESVALPPPRVAVPALLSDICACDPHARASHALGKSYSDVVRGFRGHFDHPPDFVAHPRDENDVERVLEWCASERVAAIPFGGGTSVVGGVSPDVGPAYNGAVSIDLGALDRVLEVDHVSRSARIQAGALGPDLERQLAEHGLTLRHFPQSFELSTLGGLDRHARRRPFRDRVDAYRGSRRVRTRDHAGGPVGVAAAARLGRRGEPGPDARRLGGDAGGDHRGVGARAASPLSQAL